jgi:hypothetical protein
MASWDKVVRHIERNYKIADRTGGDLALVFGLPNDRTQVVGVSRSVTGGGDTWVAIESPIGPVPSGRLLDLLQTLNTKVCGSAVAKGDIVYLKHVIPVASFDSKEFDWALKAVTSTADEMERRYLPGDAF